MVALGRAPAGGGGGSEMSEVGDTGGPVTAAHGEMEGERSGKERQEMVGVMGVGQGYKRDLG